MSFFADIRTLFFFFLAFQPSLKTNDSSGTFQASGLYWNWGHLGFELNNYWVFSLPGVNTVIVDYQGLTV